MAGAQVRAEKTQHVRAHLLEVAAARQFTQVETQIAERGDGRCDDQGDQHQVDQTIHANLQRSRRLL
ncbi:hypothetical protein D3C85_1817470 [compost metagenome]